MRSRNILLGLIVSLAVFTLTRCGSGRMLESITVDGVTSANGTTFTATGHYSAAPTTVSGIQVAWFQTGIDLDPPGPKWDYSMTRSPFKGNCPGGPASVYAVAYAPQDPNAPAQGSMPFQVFASLVEQHKNGELDGYVAGSAAFTCNTVQMRIGGPQISAGF